MKKFAILALTVVAGMTLSGCTQPASVPTSETLEEFNSSTSFEELQDSAIFKDWVKAVCTGSDLREIASLDFLTIPENVNAPSKLELVETRSSRIGKASKTLPASLKIMKEVASWDQQTVEDPWTSDWIYPLSSFENRLKISFADDTKAIDNFSSLNTQVQDSVKASWMDACNLTSPIEEARSVLSNYEEVVAERIDLTSSLLKKAGYKENAEGAFIKWSYKHTSEGPSIIFSGYQTKYCTGLDNQITSIDFSVPGRTNADGLTPDDFTSLANADDNIGFGASEPILWVKSTFSWDTSDEFASPKEYNFKKVNITSLGCR
jgi:hypothetical protein